MASGRAAGPACGWLDRVAEGAGHNRDLCVSLCFRKVNKCYRGRSCPITVHCRQVQPLPWPQERASGPRSPPAGGHTVLAGRPRPRGPRRAEASCRWAKRSCVCTSPGLCGRLPGARACTLTALSPSRCCAPDPDPGHGPCPGPRHARPSVEPCAGGRDRPGAVGKLARLQLPQAEPRPPPDTHPGPAGAFGVPAPARGLSHHGLQGARLSRRLLPSPASRDVASWPG